ncbi:unnamed protein product [Bursaphelenchus xylophilus]|uniref:(pine wood nematode) hypothetical protein n=1 Tax=Bursaphelenchus xylophilus TaxID=6326 RepID=A0A1I7SAK5_BURXY|nr:unnamed protein product [Bursaphelenchus xylophilus]CAG9079272.1 unnamed protein product [Bursaphelenchus xylophilus]
MSHEKLPSLKEIIRVLATYNGRDKAVRCIYFSLILLSTKVGDPEIAKKIFSLAKELSKSRLIFRQLNIPSLFYTASKVPDDLEHSRDLVDTGLAGTVTWIFSVQNVIELLAYLSDHQLVSVETAKWFRWALYLWVLAMFHGLIRLAWRLRRASRQRENNELSEKAYQEVTKSDRIALLGLGSDFIAGVASLPHRFLWAGRLSKAQHAAFSLVASFVGLYKCF